MLYYETNILTHHGIRGQKWGKRNGPPYPLSGRQYSQAEEKFKNKTGRRYSDTNKKHYDFDISKGSKLQTLSYDKDRTKNSDMFYASYDAVDKHLYKSLFNQPIKELDKKVYKYKIVNEAKSDLKVASEDSGAKAFSELYSKDRDFSNYVLDKDRMQAAFDDSKYRFKGYQESREVLEKMREKGYTPTSTDLKTVYRMYNFTIPFDGRGNNKAGQDSLNQRKKFFNALSKDGYGAVLDTNDSLYGGLHANSPVIVFDSSQLVPKSIERATLGDKVVSDVIMAHVKAMPFI